jgi:hypothetical protein
MYKTKKNIKTYNSNNMKSQNLKELPQGLPVNIEGIIRLQGIELDKNAKLTDVISGEIRKIGEENYRISVQGSEHYYRKRFTMAHELGHFLLHKDKIGDGVNDTPAYRTYEKAELFNTNITAEHETEANSFAAALLMPKEAVEYYLEEKKSLKEMSVIFQMSEQALRIRIKNLDLQINN